MYAERLFGLDRNFSGPDPKDTLMATTTATTKTPAAKRPATAKRTTANRSAAAKRAAAAKTPAARTTAARKGATTRGVNRTKADVKAVRSDAGVVADDAVSTGRSAALLAGNYAERAAYVQVGAVLTARDTVVETLDELRTKYGTRDAAEKEIKKLEKRGAGARTRAQREVKKNRTRVERELRTFRKDAEAQVKTLRSEVEQLPVNLTTNVQDLIVPVIDRAAQVAKDVQDRVITLAA